MTILVFHGESANCPRPLPADPLFHVAVRFPSLWIETQILRKRIVDNALLDKVLTGLSIVEFTG